MSIEIRRAKTTETIADKIDIANQSTPEHPEITYWKNVVKSVPNAPEINPEMLELFNKYPKFFRRFAIGRRAVTLHYDTKDYENLVDTYFNEDSPIYKPKYAKLIDKTTPILKYITAEAAKLTPRN